MKFSKNDLVIHGLAVGKVIKTSPELVVRFKTGLLSHEDVTFPANSDAYAYLRKK